MPEVQGNVAWQSLPLPPERRLAVLLRAGQLTERFLTKKYGTILL